MEKCFKVWKSVIGKALMGKCESLENLQVIIQFFVLLNIKMTLLRRKFFPACFTFILNQCNSRAYIKASG